LAGALTEIAVVLKLATSSLGRRLTSREEPAPNLSKFVIGMQQVIDQAPEGLIADFKWLAIPANKPPWVSTNMTLSPDDEVTYFMEGRVYSSQLLDIWLEPAMQIWRKTGDKGIISRGPRGSHSFRTEETGELFFGNSFPNDWSDEQGNRKHPDTVYENVSGEVSILVIRWAGDALGSLKKLLTTGDYDGRLKNEIERYEGGDTTPSGWHYLWHLGPGEIYHSQQSPAGGPCIHCHTQGNVGILQRDVEISLTELTEISWRWCIDQLPSTLREDTAPSHDYLSIAVEFDNGRDITYYWSRSLPVGMGYDCPLPDWKDREYHIVIRTGEKGLGEWHDERRNLFDDYKHYLGDPPGKIVRVWLIANSIFQRNPGICDYSDISLHGPEGETRVL